MSSRRGGVALHQPALYVHTERIDPSFRSTMQCSSKSFEPWHLPAAAPLPGMPAIGGDHHSAHVLADLPRERRIVADIERDEPFTAAPDQRLAQHDAAANKLRRTPLHVARIGRVAVNRPGAASRVIGMHLVPEEPEPALWVQPGKRLADANALVALHDQLCAPTMIDPGRR